MSTEAMNGHSIPCLYLEIVIGHKIILNYYVEPQTPKTLILINQFLLMTLNYTVHTITLPHWSRP